MAEMITIPPPFGGREKEAPIVLPPSPESAEEPSPGEKLVTFDFSYEGPTGYDLPVVPKPITRISPVVSPEKTLKLPTGVEASLEFIAKAMALLTSRPISFVTGNVTCQQSNRGYQFPNFEIPFGKKVVVKAWYTNVGVIYVAYRQADSQNVAVGWPLIANEGVSWEIPNVNGVWAMASTAGEGASFTVEQE